MMNLALNKRYIQALIQIIIAAGAIPGGITFLIDPSGARSGTSSSLLINSPFVDFFFPGLFLLVIIGGGNLVSSIVTFLKIEVSGFLGIILGIILMLWIVLQVYWIGYGSLLQPFFFLIGSMETLIGYRLLRSVVKGI